MKRTKKTVAEEEIWDIIEKQERINPIFKILGFVALIFFGFTALSIKESRCPYWQFIRTGIWFAVLCLIITFLYSGYSYRMFSKLKELFPRLTRKLRRIIHSLNRLP